MKLFIFFFSIILFCGNIKAQEGQISTENDSTTLAQAYMNLYLTSLYFDTLESSRTEKILRYEKNELDKIKSPEFLRGNQTIYQFTQSLYYLNLTKSFYSDRRTQAILSQSNPQRKSYVIRLKNLLDNSIRHYNNSSTDEVLFINQPINSFFQLIGFTLDADYQHKNNILTLKEKINDEINEELYLDFQRFLRKVKLSKDYDLDSMEILGKNYGIPINTLVQTNQIQPSTLASSDLNTINPAYYVDLRAEVIFRYVELLALLKGKNSREADHDLLNSKYKYWINRLNSVDDEFIKMELNSTEVESIKKQIDSISKKNSGFSSIGGITKGRRPTSIKKPEAKPGLENVEKLDPPLAEEAPPIMYSKKINKNYFPSPPPKASATYVVQNFKEELASLNQVDTFFKSILENQGYKDQLHYYYFNQVGFALATSLEKFNLDGTAVVKNKRFVESMGSEGHFSYFEIVKSMFLDIESEYRFFTFIIDSQQAKPSGEGLSAPFSEQILSNSYQELPEDLKSSAFSPKALTVLVYHFHQNDIGKVPELKLIDNLTIQQYLQLAGLTPIIQ
ncbi:hypothetical protein JYB64_14705 [Algoriphagus aestuarii]|nr:hypothetical protein [Algoriphagus aestuarii]